MTGTAILYTTHYMEEAERLCTRIGIIDAGKLIAEGTRSELVAKLGHDARIEIGLGRGERLERRDTGDHRARRGALRASD